MSDNSLANETADNRREEILNFVGHVAWVIMQSADDVSPQERSGGWQLNSGVNDTVLTASGWHLWQLDAYVIIATRLLPAIFVCISILAVTGNAAVIFVITRRKKMRTPINVFLMNLAVSDVIFASVAMPIVTYRYASVTWRGGEFLCRIHTYVIHTAIYVSAYTMAAIAAYRCICITRGRWKLEHTSVKRVIIIIISLWVVMILANLPLVSLYHVKTVEGHVYCGLNHGKELFLIFFMCAYLLPITISIICYSILITSLFHTTVPSAESMTSSHARKVRVTRLLIVILLAFAICWLPMQVQLLKAYRGHPTVDFTHELIRLFSCCLGIGSTAVNPFIYNFVSRDFRSSFRSLISLAACSHHIRKPQLRL